MPSVGAWKPPFGIPKICASAWAWTGCTPGARSAATGCSCDSALAIVLLTLPGAAGESLGYDRMLKANTEKRRTHFIVLFLDNRHRVIALETLFTGTIDGASVHPRVVVRRALELNSAAVILAHNHPSGAVEPSHADVAITGRLREALNLVDVRVLDHLIVGAEGGLSFAELGLL